jgi:hypothetical protein
MTTKLAVVDQDAHAVMETVMLKGDLAQLTPEERNDYYMAVCKSVGLNPLTKPFDYIMLEGRLTLYARKDCAEQLRKINGVSTHILSKTLEDDIYTVHISAKDRQGREDEDIGAVVMVYPAKMKTREGWKDHPKAGKPLKGLDRANALMKAVTKAKRRVTLSISGLGLPDETEVDDMLAAEPAGPKAPTIAITPPAPGEAKPLPPLVGQPPAEPAKAEEEKPDPLADYKAALAKPTSVAALERAHKKHAKGITDSEDEDLIQAAREVYREALDRIKGGAEDAKQTGLELDPAEATG